MIARILLAAGFLGLVAVPAIGQVDPTDPERLDGIMRRPGVVLPFGPFGPGTPATGQGPAGGPQFEAAAGRGGANGTPLPAADAVEAYREAVRAQLDAVDAAVDKINADPSSNDDIHIKDDITHQPLIHVKVRIVEVQRADSLAVSSVLDFITSNGGAAPFGDNPFTQNTVNLDRRRIAGFAQFPVAELVDVAGSGTGMLVNLTTAHVNYLASFLATELNADTITAPQVTTLNGKNVMFRAGSKIPFALGQNFIQGDTNTIQEVFYKHVGTFVSVTPQIVNWGKNHEGLGRVRLNYATVNPEKVPVRYQEILDLRKAMVQAITSTALAARIDQKQRDRFQILAKNFEKLTDADKIAALDEVVGVLNVLLEKPGVTRSLLTQELDSAVAPPIPQPDAGLCEHCNWNPSDCTINLNLAVRLSDPGSVDTEKADGDAVVAVKLSSENNVRAISNVVQIKSGHGVVIGGLIAMRDAETVSKVPIIGDIPIVGAVFRSTQTGRVKTETLIFVEATVLPSFECVDQCGKAMVKGQTERDFCNGKVHVQGELCDGPLSYGMHRAGLQGDYLPRPSHREWGFWKQYLDVKRHQRHHRQTTHLLDTFE